MPKSLYERLGGYDAIAALVDDFMGHMFSDKQVGRFYIGHSANSKKRLRQLIVEILCEVAGGPVRYIGRDLKTAHLGLCITESDWQIAVSNIKGALERLKLQQKEIDEVLATVSNLKPAIAGI